MKLYNVDFRVFNEDEAAYYYSHIEVNKLKQDYNTSIMLKDKNNNVNKNGSIAINDNIEIYTGLIDVNGKKLYVNDIVRILAKQQGNMQYYKDYILQGDLFKGIGFRDVDFLEGYTCLSCMQLNYKLELNKVNANIRYLGNIHD